MYIMRHTRISELGCCLLLFKKESEKKGSSVILTEEKVGMTAALRSSAPHDNILIPLAVQVHSLPQTL